MPTDASFRFSTYLTLALACVALGYAEMDLLPEVAFIATVAVVALGALYFLESRVTFLSIPAANRLGLVVGVLYLMWAGYRVKRELTTAEFINMDWQVLIVALCGPLVMLAIVAKVARKDKHAGDYWGLHGAALAGVGLAAALAEDIGCFLLLGAYLVAAVWSLTLLYLGRASGSVPPIPGPGGRQPATKTVAVSADPTGHRTDFRPALLWAILSLAVAIPLYLLTPRSGADKADLGKPRIEIGYSADQMVDLNRTGPLKANGQVAFEFTAAYPDGSPKTDVNREQLWEGKALRHYSGGEWRPSEDPLPPISYASPNGKGQSSGQARRTDGWTPPNLGPNQFTLTFDVPTRLHSDFRADPVLWVPDQSPPLAELTESGPQGWIVVGNGTFYWDHNFQKRNTPLRYLQVYRAAEDPTVSPPFYLVPGANRADLEQALGPLRHNPIARVKEYADGLLDDLVRRGELPRDFRDELSDLPQPQYQALIARKFAAHFATTPTLTYTTELRRDNKQVDPIEDFLFYTKAGHCERFATALALMLRSQGIPTLLVLGFKGCEPAGGGKYIVRQEHAHAWVRALVPKPGQPEPVRDPRLRVYQWLSLDPTPVAIGADANSPWWKQANKWVENNFEEYVTNYSAAHRRRTLTQFFSRVTRAENLAAIAGVVVAILALRFGAQYVGAWWRRKPTTPEHARWFGELVALLAAHGIAPAPGQTPMEFATAAAAALRARGCEADAAEVPLAWAEAYYQDRFGGMPPSDARIAELDAALEGLRQALANRGA